MVAERGHAVRELSNVVIVDSVVAGVGGEHPGGHLGS